MFSRSRIFQLWKTALTPVLDYLALVGAAGLSYLLRYRWLEEDLGGVKNIRGAEFLQYSFLFALSVVVVYIFLGLYDLSYRISLTKLIFRLIIGIFLPLMVYVLIAFFYQYDTEVLPENLRISRFIIAVGGILAFYFVILSRLTLWALEKSLHFFGVGKIGVICLGESGLELDNYINNRSDISKYYKFSKLDESNFGEIKSLIKNYKISELYVNSLNSNLESELADFCERYKVSYFFSPLGFRNYEAYGVNPLHIRNTLYLELKHSKLDGWRFILKRIFDIVFSIVFLLAFAWLYILIAVLIKLEDRGPVFYFNDRVGPNGKAFKLIKFRRMKTEFCVDGKNLKALDYEEQLIKSQNLKPDDPQYKIINDPRNTKIGKFIEKYSLDELPQFVNVLLGNMSVVGPRPHQPRDVDKYSKEHFKVLNIKPGITGLAQVSGRSDLDFETEVKLDRFYIENWSFRLDIWIVIKTPLVMLIPTHKS